MVPRPPSVTAVVETIQSIVSRGIDACISIPSSAELPDIDLATARDLCALVSTQFALEPTLLELTGDFTIIGDLHGHVLDFLRILACFGMPPGTRYILLGDLVDRGPFSVHTAMYAFALKCVFPTDFLVIRGNHEFADMNATHGLRAEIQARYEKMEIFEAMNAAFSLMPLGARVNGDILCIHGGLGPELETVAQIARVQRPFTGCEDPIVEAIMWSDPNAEVSMRRSLARVKGWEFGEAALVGFLEANKLRLIVRGHEAIAEGVKWQLGGRMVTVFSVSNYCGKTDGQSGVLQVGQGKPDKEERLPTLPYVVKQEPPTPPVERPRSSSLTSTRSGCERLTGRVQSSPPITVIKAPGNRAKRVRRGSEKGMAPKLPPRA
jgi:protein phosphatase